MGAHSEQIHAIFRNGIRNKSFTCSDTSRLHPKYRVEKTGRMKELHPVEWICLSPAHRAGLASTTHTYRSREVSASCGEGVSVLSQQLLKSVFVNAIHNCTRESGDSFH